MVNIDYTLFFYVMVIMPIILAVSMLFITTVINKKNESKVALKIDLSFFLDFSKKLILKDYSSFEKYEIWRFTEYKEYSSRF